MATIQRFEEIEAWQTARELTRFVYQLSNRDAFARDFGLKDQMRRAAVSVLSNIAEGHEGRTPSLFIEFLGRAKGSCGEVRAQSYVALDAGYVSHEEFNRLHDMSDKCIRQIANFIAYLESANRHTRSPKRRRANP